MINRTLLLKKTRTVLKDPPSLCPILNFLQSLILPLTLNSPTHNPAMQPQNSRELLLRLRFFHQMQQFLLRLQAKSHRPTRHLFSIRLPSYRMTFGRGGLRSTTGQNRNAWIDCSPAPCGRFMRAGPSWERCSWTSDVGNSSRNVKSLMVEMSFWMKGLS